MSLGTIDNPRIEVVGTYALIGIAKRGGELLLCCRYTGLCCSLLHLVRYTSHLNYITLQLGVTVQRSTFNHNHLPLPPLPSASVRTSARMARCKSPTQVELDRWDKEKKRLARLGARRTASKPCPKRHSFVALIQKGKHRRMRVKRDKVRVTEEIIEVDQESEDGIAKESEGGKNVEVAARDGKVMVRVAECVN